MVGRPMVLVRCQYHPITPYMQRDRSFYRERACLCQQVVALGDVESKVDFSPVYAILCQWAVARDGSVKDRSDRRRIIFCGCPFSGIQRDLAPVRIASRSGFIHT